MIRLKGVGQKNKRRPAITPPVEQKRDAYGFIVRPQHLQQYREYAKIYREEEEERSERWKDFLERLAELCEQSLATEEESAAQLSIVGGLDDNHSNATVCHASEAVVPGKAIDRIRHKVQMLSHIRPSLGPIDRMFSYRVKMKKQLFIEKPAVGRIRSHPASSKEEEVKVARLPRSASEVGLKEHFCGFDRPELFQDGLSSDYTSFSPCKEELESLVRGGVPMALRGELWQAFVGVRTRRIDGYYSKLLADDDRELDFSNLCVANDTPKTPQRCYPEIWKGQIEKDLPRTFPGHPALDRDGRDALRRLLTAYARHNPCVGYCQAMNFFAGLLLLMMPEENAFWTLLAIIDDYFHGYYSEDMIEAQVDQLVFEDLAHEKFPKLVNHLDYLGVQVACATGPWFLSIFVNILPWESVLRVWDVLLFDGNRVMLFRTALALLELYGPSLAMKKDAGDAITLLQSLASSTFDGSQLVLTACMGYQSVNEIKLQDLRKKHRSTVIATMEKRYKGLHALKDPNSLDSQLYSTEHEPETLCSERNSPNELDANGEFPLKIGTADGYSTSLKVDNELESDTDFQEQVTCLKAELCRLLGEKRSAVGRAEVLETALMEIAKQDNRRLLSTKIEQLEQESFELRQALSSKHEQEQAMLEVLARIEQEQRSTEDSRMFAEQDAVAQKYASYVLQEKYEVAMASLAQMEKRALAAESMLEATLQHHSSHIKSHQIPSSPGFKLVLKYKYLMPLRGLIGFIKFNNLQLKGRIHKLVSGQG